MMTDLECCLYIKHRSEVSHKGSDRLRSADCKGHNISFILKPFTKPSGPGGGGGVILEETMANNRIEIFHRRKYFVLICSERGGFILEEGGVILENTTPIIRIERFHFKNIFVLICRGGGRVIVEETTPIIRIETLNCRKNFALICKGEAESF